MLTARVACKTHCSTLNDSGARKFQFYVSSTQTCANSVDGVWPMGPCVVTPDELADPQAVPVKWRVSKLPMHGANTAGTPAGVLRLLQAAAMTLGR